MESTENKIAFLNQCTVWSQLRLVISWMFTFLSCLWGVRFIKGAYTVAGQDTLVFSLYNGHSQSNRAFIYGPSVDLKFGDGRELNRPFPRSLSFLPRN